MPSLSSGKKALRQSKKHAERNKIIREEIRSMRRRFRKMLEKGQLDDAKKMIPEFDKKLDKAVTKHMLKKNKSARLKSRIAAMLHKAAEATE